MLGIYETFQKTIIELTFKQKINICFTDESTLF